MWNRIVALALLAAQLVVHVVRSLWRRRRGEEVFRENFEPEGLLGLSAQEGVLLARGQQCTGCRACDVVCPGLEATTGARIGPAQIVSTYVRDMSTFADLAPHVGTVAAQCAGCRACEAACPEAVPIMDLVGLLEGYGARAAAAKGVGARQVMTPLAGAPMALWGALLWGALLVWVSACGGEGAKGALDAAEGGDPLRALRAGAQSSEALPEPLAEAEALQLAGNMLTPDPTPWRHPAAVDGGTLRRGVEYLPGEYNWLTNNTTDVHQINAYVVETVAVRHQEDPSQWAPRLARAVTVNPEGTEYTVHLRRGVLWHRPAPQAREDNRRISTDDAWVPLTARDFEFAFRMLKDVRVRRAAPARSWYSSCNRLEVIDDYTFTIRWDEPGLASLLGTMTLSPLPEHIFAFDSSGERYRSPAAMLDAHWYVWPIGTGPYMTEAMGSQSSSYLILARNPRYYATKPAIEALSYEAVDGETIIERFQQGLLDVVELSPWQYQSMVLSAPLGNPFRTGELRLATYSELGFSYIGWNMRDGPTADVRVRRALTLGLDRERMARDLARGMAKVSPGPFPSKTPDSDPDIAPLPFDLLAAAAQLDEAGWRDLDGDGWRERVVDEDGGEVEPLTVRVVFASLEGDFWARAIGMYAQDLARIGVRLVPDNIAFSGDNYEDRINTGDFEGFINGWGMDWENDLFQVWHASQADIPEGSNRIGFSDDAVDALIEAVRAEPNAAKRLELQHEIHRRIHDLQPYTFALEDEVILAFSDRIQGVRFQKLRPHDMSIPWWINAR
jgi:peptide/nickel transport system substrate-binding protein